MKNVVVMWDGLNSWKSAGHPVDPPAAGGAADPGAEGAADDGSAPLMITVPAGSPATPVLP